MLEAGQGVSLGLPAGIDIAIVGALVAGVALAGAFALLRGYGRDPLERLSRWASGRGLEYVPPVEPDEIASFVGVVENHRVEVRVRRVPGRRLVDLPPQVTTIAVGAAGADTVAVIQPAAWVLDSAGRALTAPLSTGDAAFDARWSAYVTDPDDAGALAALLSPAMRERLLRPDAEGLVIELSSGGVAIPMPGVCAEPRELDRRLAIASDLARQEV